MLLKSLNKPLILRIVLIIGFFLVVVFVTRPIIEKSLSLQREKEQKEVERLYELYKQGELTKEVEEKIYQSCFMMANELKSGYGCEIFREGTGRDGCYFCFAITKKDKLFCNKITEGTPLRKRCEKEFLVIEEMEWKTYRNEDYGFEIKYPQDWNYGPNILQVAPNTVFCPPEFSDPDPELGCKWESENGHMLDSLAPIYLFVTKKPGGTFTLDDLSMQECEKSEKQTINNILMKISDCGERGQESIWYGPGNAYIFRLFLEDSSFLDIFNQMLSSFKF